MYALTEFLAQKYESLSKDAQSDTNTRILDLFNQAKSHLTLTNSCSSSPTDHLKLRAIIDELIPLMAVPLLRGLFYYLSIRDAVKIKVYALSVLPLFSTCSKSSYMELKGQLIDNDDVGEVNKELIFSKIQSMYDCLGRSMLCAPSFSWAKLRSHQFTLLFIRAELRSCWLHGSE